MRRSGIAAAWALLALCLGPASVQAAEGDWAGFGNDPGGSQYSALDQISAANVARLKLAWSHRSGDVAKPEIGRAHV